MLLGSLFYLKEFSVMDGSMNAFVDIDRSHPIFAGHFPGQPVLPGVCMIQLSKELLEKASGLRLMLVEGDNIKFLSVVDPNANSAIQIDIAFTRDADRFSAMATFFAGSVTFFKLKAVFKIFD